MCFYGIFFFVKKHFKLDFATAAQLQKIAGSGAVPASGQLAPRVTPRLSGWTVCTFYVCWTVSSFFRVISLIPATSRRFFEKFLDLLFGPFFFFFFFFLKKKALWHREEFKLVIRKRK